MIVETLVKGLKIFDFLRPWSFALPSCFLFFLSPFSLMADPPKEHVLYVKAKKELTSLYLSQFFLKQSSLSTDYLKQLYDILYTDFACNGFSEIKPKKESVEKILKTTPGQIAKDLPARHTLYFEIEGHTLKTNCYNANILAGANLEDVHLTGQLPLDAARIHALADSLCELMYGERGIASCDIIYCQKKDAASSSSQMCIKNFDGLAPREILDEKTVALFPIFVPLASKIIYTDFTHKPRKLYICHVNSTKGSPLLHHLLGDQLFPAISARGDLLAFVSNAAGWADLFVVQLKKDQTICGKPVQVYTNPKAAISCPTFNEDGSKLAFVSDHDGITGIYILDVIEVLRSHKTPKLQCITKKNKVNEVPSWSPDGKKIAYSAKTEGIYQIWIYDCETKEEYQLTEGPEDKENPSWAPNSLHLVYNTTSPSYDLFVINLNQLKAIQITHGPEIKHYPYWDRTIKRPQ